MASIIWFYQADGERGTVPQQGVGRGRGGAGQGQGRTYRVALFDKGLVIPAEGDEEENGGDVLEAVDPLAALGFLAADVDHDKLLRAGHGEVHLGDARRARAGEYDILRCGAMEWHGMEWQRQQYGSHGSHGSHGNR